MAANIVWVFIFGCVFGLSELISRYPETRYMGRVWQTYAYVLMNGAISIGALFLIKYFKKEHMSPTDSLEINNIIIAGFGGMMILRSSIFSIKNKGKKIDIGIGTIAQIFLDNVERKMATSTATIRMEELDEVMKNIDYDKAKDELSTLCISYIDNFSEEDEKELNKAIKALSNVGITNHNKSLQLGKLISRYCDYRVLCKAIEKLGNTITIVGPIDSKNPEESINSWIFKLKKKT